MRKALFKDEDGVLKREGISNCRSRPSPLRRREVWVIACEWRAYFKMEAPHLKLMAYKRENDNMMSVRMWRNCNLHVSLWG